MKVFADTSWFIALLNRRDQHHHAALQQAGFRTLMLSD
jgi:predicted nucleic acid-binding protein